MFIYFVVEKEKEQTDVNTTSERLLKAIMSKKINSAVW